MRRSASDQQRPASDEIDGVEEPSSGAGADATPGDGDRAVALAGAGAADEDDVALLGQKAAAGEIAHEVPVDRRPIELNVVDILGEREFGDGELVSDRARLLFGDLGGKEIADDALRLVLA